MKLKSLSVLAALSASLVAIAVTAVFAAGATAAQPHAAGTTVSTRHTSLGTILVGPNGKTLYLWEADSRNHSTCSGACAEDWPPLMLHGKLKAAGGVKSSLLGSTARKGGRQVTYNGHPLYYFAGDSSAGQTNGEGSNGFGAEWDVLSTAGKGIDG